MLGHLLSLVTLPKHLHLLALLVALVLQVTLVTHVAAALVQRLGHVGLVHVLEGGLVFLMVVSILLHAAKCGLVLDCGWKTVQVSILYTVGLSYPTFLNM